LNLSKIFTLLLSLCSIYTLTHKEDLKISIIIPCHFRHAHLLHPLLKLYERQTMLPDEVVISLSEAYLVDDLVIEKLQNKPWLFRVKLLLSNDKKYAGQNRNLACSNADGHIFICQDADDIPHPQRVETIIYFFERFSIHHLMHRYIYADDFSNFSWCNKQRTAFIKPQSYNAVWKAWNNTGQFTNGNPAIDRYVFQQIQWSDSPRGQDSEFNKEVYRRIDRRLVIWAPLLVYREELSSKKEDNADGAFSCTSNAAKWERLYDQFYTKYRHKFPQASDKAFMPLHTCTIINQSDIH